MITRTSSIERRPCGDAGGYRLLLEVLETALRMDERLLLFLLLFQASDTPSEHILQVEYICMNTRSRRLLLGLESLEPMTK